MNKKTKGLAALAAGAALVFGGAGTFALWFDTAALGASVTPIATGDLHLAQDKTQTGHWAWKGVSHTNSNSLVTTPATPFAGKLVPGDSITWEWDTTAIQYFLAGDTIVADLYLDGVGTVSSALLAPLTLGVSFPGGSTASAVINADGSVLIKSGLTATPEAGTTLSITDLTNIPTLTVSFDKDARTNVGSNAIGHAPSSSVGYTTGITGSGYGRLRTNVQVLDLSGVKVRLQQVPTS